MYKPQRYSSLKRQHHRHGSWAIWDTANPRDTSIIDREIGSLKSTYVLIGLNISKRKPKNWGNFHGGKHDRKLMYACNNTRLRGVYLTDLFKNVSEVSAHKLSSRLTEKKIAGDVAFFRKEMTDIGITSRTVFVVFGKEAKRMYQRHFAKHFKNSVIYNEHYSRFKRTDEDWVQRFWRSLKMYGHRFDDIRKQYKRQKN